VPPLSEFFYDERDSNRIMRALLINIEKPIYPRPFHTENSRKTRVSLVFHTRGFKYVSVEKIEKHEKTTRNM